MTFGFEFLIAGTLATLVICCVEEWNLRARRAPRDPRPAGRPGRS